MDWEEVSTTNLYHVHIDKDVHLKQHYLGQLTRMHFIFGDDPH